jgi:hypothetical protein
MVTAWPCGVKRPATPMSPSCFPGIPYQRAVLDLVVRNRDPATLDEHSNAIGGYAIGCRHAVLLRAAASAILVDEVTVYVVGLHFGGPKSKEERTDGEVGL